MTAPHARVAVGDSWVESPVIATSVDLVHWAAGTDDYTDFHFDAEAARARGFAGPVVNGPWKARAMKALVHKRFDPDPVTITGLTIDYRLPDVVNQAMTFTFDVTEVTTATDGSVLVALCATVTNEPGDVTTRAEISLAVGNGVGIEELPLERVKQVVSLGQEHGPFIYKVYGSDVDRYQRISGREADRLDDIMPAAFFGAIDPVERRDLDLDSFLLELPIPKVGGGNAFNEVQYERPIKAGETLTVMTTYTDVYEKPGRVSRLLFRVRENVYRDEAGEKVAVSTNGHVIAYAPEEVTL